MVAQDQGGRNYSGEKWVTLRLFLKSRANRFSDGLDMKCEIKGESRMLPSVLA